MTETSGYSLDVILSFVAGRMSKVKAKLVELIKAADGSLIVLSNWRFNVYEAQIFPLATVRIGTSTNIELSYGRRITKSYHGNYTIFSFSIHVFDFNVESDPIRGKDVQETAYKIYKYLLTHNKDADAGILDIYDVTMRESNPAGALRLSRVIIEGSILVERPMRKS